MSRVKVEKKIRRNVSKLLPCLDAKVSCVGIMTVVLTQSETYGYMRRNITGN